MFVFNRSAAAVLVPLALLAVVVWWSGHGSTAGLEADTKQGQVATVARADPPPAGY